MMSILLSNLHHVALTRVEVRAPSQSLADGYLTNTSYVLSSVGHRGMQTSGRLVALTILRV